MRRPDYGNTMWRLGWETTKHCLINIRWTSIADYDDFREVTGFIDTDDGTFCLTLRTKQTRAELLKLVRKFVAATGTLALTEEVGDSGERYRVLIGAIEPMENDEEAA